MVKPHLLRRIAQIGNSAKILRWRLFTKWSVTLLCNLRRFLEKWLWGRNM